MTELEEKVMKNQGLVKYMVNNLTKTWSNDYFDDFVQIGTIGLIKAAESFDESKGITFATYASRCIKNEIFMFLRKEKKVKDNISLDEPISVDFEGKELTLSELVPDNSVQVDEKIEQRSNIEEYFNIILNVFEPRDRSILLYKIAGVNQRVIADKLQISQSYISRLEKKLEEKAKKYLNNGIKFEAIFSMVLLGEKFRIIFHSKDVKNFNKILATFCRKLREFSNLPDFAIKSDSKRIIIHLDTEVQAFGFVAEIMEEIDEFSIKFEAENDILVDNVVTKTNENKEIEEVEGTESYDRDAILKELKPNRTAQVRNFILSKNTFTRKEIKQEFPDLANSNLSSILSYIKNTGLIKSVGIGKYVVNRN